MNFHSIEGGNLASFDNISPLYGWIFYFISNDVCNGVIMVVMILCGRENNQKINFHGTMVILGSALF